MKRLFSLVASLLFALCITAQTYTPADAGSAVKFTIKNFGLTVNGSFTGVQGKIIFQPTNLGASTFTVAVNAATVNTGNGSRDAHLKKEEYFDVVKFPKLQFVSTGITAGDKTGTYNITGLLTIKGTAKTIAFPFTATPTATGYQFAGSFSINRRDFKVGGNSLVLSDMLNVSLNISAVK